MNILHYLAVRGSICLVFGLSITLFSSNAIGQQKIASIERERLVTMLQTLQGAIKRDYYDPAFHGIDLDVRFGLAKERLKQVQTLGQGFAVIAQVLLDFNDSHLFFQPPLTNLDVDYGWRDRMIGDKCFVLTVKPKSDAEKKGLKVGDQILTIEGHPVNRTDLWKMNYYYNTLNKQKALRLSVLSPGGTQPRDLQIESKLFTNRGARAGGQLSELYYSSGTEFDLNLFANIGSVTIWKMPSFGLNPNSIDSLMDRVKSSTSVILDLRGNGGGYVLALERLAGFMFDKELTIAELKGRKKMDPQKSKPSGSTFTGRLVVLTDADSASASEIFARLVQLEGRGKVVGDVSAGSVMQSVDFTGTMSNDSIAYGASITNADVIMSDGKSLEKVGVIPDERVIPTAEDLANGHDPVLARAIQMLGGSISPEDAGKLFVYEWKDEKVRMVKK